METEFKIVLPDKESFTNVLRALETRGSGPGSTKVQVNHFFDTADLALRSGRYALRLREENARFKLTAKGASKVEGDAVLVSRPEVECEVDAATAGRILEGKTSPLEALIATQTDESDLLLQMRAACASQPLRHLGSFTNERTMPEVLTLDVGGDPVELQFEIDCTTFPGERIERELELEIDAQHAPAVESFLRELLEECSIPWKTTSSKAKRFFAALG